MEREHEHRKLTDEEVEEIINNPSRLNSINYKEVGENELKEILEKHKKWQDTNCEKANKLILDLQT